MCRKNTPAVPHPPARLSPLLLLFRVTAPQPAAIPPVIFTPVAGYAARFADNTPMPRGPGGAATLVTLLRGSWKEREVFAARWGHTIGEVGCRNARQVGANGMSTNVPQQ